MKPSISPVAAWVESPLAATAPLSPPCAPSVALPPVEPLSAEIGRAHV